MKLSARDKATLAKTKRPGYTFRVKNFPPGFKPQPWEPPKNYFGRAPEGEKF